MVHTGVPQARDAARGRSKPPLSARGRLLVPPEGSSGSPEGHRQGRVKESLGTNSFDEAKTKVRLRAVETDREIGAARARIAGSASPPLTQQEARLLADAELASWLGGDESARMERGWGAYESTSWLIPDGRDGGALGTRSLVELGLPLRADPLHHVPRWRLRLASEAPIRKSAPCAPTSERPARRIVR